MARSWSRRLMHPAVAMATVWTIVLGCWWLLPAARFSSVTHSGRVQSPVGIMFLLTCVAAFVVCALLCSSPRPERASSTTPEVALNAEQLRRLELWSVRAAGIGLAGVVYLLVAGSLRLGGPFALIKAIVDGTPWSTLSDQYFTPARIQGLTIWVQLLPAAGALAMLGIGHEASPRQRRHFQLVLVTGFAGSLLIALMLSDRLAIYEYLLVIGGVSLARPGSGRKIVALTRRFSKFTLVVVAFGSIWFLSEYGRTYLPRAEGQEGSSEASAGQVAQDQLLAYLVSNPNNAVYVVDNFRARTFPFRTANGLFTMLGLDTPNTPIIGSGLDELATDISGVYFDDRILTTISGPGYLFTDVGWGAPILFGLFGAVGGVWYRRFCERETWAILAYPIFFVGVLDSFRILYWTQSRALVPLIAVLAASRAIRMRSAPSSVHA